MSLLLRLAWRNLWRHGRRTWLTSAAMIFSNVLLIFLISLQFGSYQMMIDNSLQIFSGHIQVQHRGYLDNPGMRRSIPAVSVLAGTLREQFPGVQVAVRASAFALASSEQRSFGIQVVGVQPSHEPNVSTLPGLISAGRYLQQGSDAEIVIGEVMANNLRIGVGDELTLLGSGRDGSLAAGIVKVVGVFTSGSQDLDRSLGELPLGYFQQTFAMPDQGHAIVLRTANLEQVPSVVSSVSGILSQDEDLVVLDWDQLQPGLKQAIRTDMSSAWFMYGVLIILVAFSVLNTQLMSVLERTHEFGVITALGVRPRMLAGLVMLETTLMALLGLAFGLLLGWLLTIYLQTTGFHYPGMEEMAGKFNLPDRIYPSLSLLSLLLGPTVVFVFSLLAAIYPALRLFRLQPVAAMRAV